VTAQNFDLRVLGSSHEGIDEPTTDLPKSRRLVVHGSLLVRTHLSSHAGYALCAAAPNRRRSGAGAYNLHEWLGEQMTACGGVAGRARTMVERGLVAGTLFMNACGLLHFDAHLGNILTDDKRLYFADYDLAISSRFEQAVVAVHEQVTSVQTGTATAVTGLSGLDV
jgi:hypothetical protein